MTPRSSRLSLVMSLAMRDNTVLSIKSRAFTLNCHVTLRFNFFFADTFVGQHARAACLTLHKNMPDVLTSDYIRQRYLAPDTLLNDFKPEPNQSGQAEIIRFLDTTQDAPVVKDLLQRYPDICEWPDFKVPHQHHCCVLSLLVESGLRHETAFPTIFAAITCEDKRALAVLARCIIMQ